jgi:hypothetical protein
MVNRHNVFVYDEVEFVTFSKVWGGAGVPDGGPELAPKEPVD